jgi:transposase
VIQPTLDWFDVYGAVAPAPGERCFLELPSLPADMCQLFVDAFAQAVPDRLNIVLLANRGTPTAQRLRWPETGRGIWRPPYGPELTPVERFWRDLKADLAGPPFTALETQQNHVSQLLQAYEASTRPSLTSYRYLVEAINARAP